MAQLRTVNKNLTCSMGKIQLTMEDPVPLKKTFDIALPKSTCKYLEDQVKTSKIQWSLDDNERYMRKIKQKQNFKNL